MGFTIECEQEEDGRWLAEVLEIPVVMAYGDTAQKAMVKAEALSFRVIAERLEHEECNAMLIHITFAAA
jgi:predicted RNase H-like HicB family nuclease